MAFQVPAHSAKFDPALATHLESNPQRYQRLGRIWFFLTLPLHLTVGSPCKMASINSDSLTLEETNKVRASLGLAPIGGPAPEGEDAPVDHEAVAEANYAERRAREKKEREDQELKERIDKCVLPPAHSAR